MPLILQIDVFLGGHQIDAAPPLVGAVLDLDVLEPRIVRLEERLGIAVAAVIEDEARIRALLGQLRAVSQFRGSQAQVEAQAQLAKLLDAANEVVRQAIAGGRAAAVQDLANALDAPCSS